MRGLIAPLILLLLSAPMIAGVLPRNSLFGFRTRHTMSSDAVWARANRVSGIAMAAAAAFWAALVLILPMVLSPEDFPLLLARRLGLGALTIAVALSFFIVYKRPARP